MATELRTEADVVEALRRRFPPPAWALFTGVADGTGGRANRWADALAMSIWPSRGLELVGFEIKTARGDFLREMKNPKKAEAVGRYCDRWWIAAGSKKICKAEELPPAWGLLVPHGDTMKIVKDAAKLDCEPVNRTFVAAILRRVAEQYDVTKIRSELRVQMRDEIRADVKKGFKSRHKHDLDTLRVYHNEAKATIAELQEQLTAAAKLDCEPQTIGRAIQLLSNLSGWNGARSKVDAVLRRIESDKKDMDEIATTLRDARDLLDVIHPVGDP